ncbi:MAG: hypothetical protein LBI20_03955 [Holosporales bacterium]|jgi:hypothetical protein|nr:hypothetical protein [Holosporales bacterium]
MKSEQVQEAPPPQKLDMQPEQGQQAPLHQALEKPDLQPEQGQQAPLHQELEMKSEQGQQASPPQEP